MKRILILALFSLLIIACGIDNTMYNAQNYFKAAQARPLNVNGRPTPQAVDEYTKSIRKCGIILSQEKPSRRADDALFLMGRALYYKGNSAFQAKDAFEGVIKGYPNSKHIPEAHIYLAKVLREINQVAASEALLERFVRDPKYYKYHPRALLVLADYEIKDKDYHRAQYWLQKIIADYRKTPEFKEAFFLFGKNYYMQGDYERSLAEFQTFQKTRGIAKEMKLEASYYIALCQYELGDYDSALKISKALIRNEIRPEKLSQAKVLNSRILLAKGNVKAGLEGLEEVTKSYPRTEQAAAAYYYWGKYFYFQEGDIDKATPHLNRVRTEFNKSPFAEKGAKIATALSQMKKPALLDSRSNLQGFLDHYYLKAEYFINPLAMPDSALVAYQRVIDEYGILLAEQDSLNHSLQTIDAQIDSLSALPELALFDAQTDIQKPEIAEETDAEDEAKEDTSEEEEHDSAEVEEDATESISALEQRRQAEAQKEQVQQRIANYEQSLKRFRDEILPFCYFSKYSIYHKLDKDGEDAERLLATMQESFPRNIYTRAAIAIKNAKVPQLIDPDLEAAEEAFDHALGYYPDAPDSLIQSMERFTESPYPKLKLRAFYRLGWYYSFEAPDTTRAKEYLQEVLSTSDSGDYGLTVRRFYDGAKYLLRDSGLPDSTAIEVDSTATDSTLDSDIEAETVEPESISPAEAEADKPLPDVSKPEEPEIPDPE